LWLPQSYALMGINGASSPACSMQSALVKHRYGPSYHKNSVAIADQC
jgi:hypothetical protein